MLKISLFLTKNTCYCMLILVVHFLHFVLLAKLRPLKFGEDCYLLPAPDGGDILTIDTRDNIQ